MAESEAAMAARQQLMRVLAEKASEKEEAMNQRATCITKREQQIEDQATLAAQNGAVVAAEHERLMSERLCRSFDLSLDLVVQFEVIDGVAYRCVVARFEPWARMC